MMKRRALLIGYSGYDLDDNGYLDGVCQDLANYKFFLQSLNGGAWLDNEIILLQDSTLADVETKIEEIKRENNDVVFCVFSGHGAFDENIGCRILEISKYEEMPENLLWELAPKQILIVDSCSEIISSQQRLVENSLTTRASVCRLAERSARRIYEDACEGCPNQQLYFYAAKKGTLAKDDDGGVYSVELLKVLKETPRSLNIVEAHDLACQQVMKQKQFPSRCVTKTHPFLPGAIGL